MGAAQTGEDLLRVFMNSAMGGLPTMIGAHAAENQQKVDAARQRLGLAGDITNIAGYLAPGAGLLKGVRALPAAVRAAPAALRAAPEVIPTLARAARVGITNLGGPGLTRAEAAARLGLEYAPNVAERAVNAAGRAIGNVAQIPLRHPFLTAATVAGGLGSYAARNNAQAVPAANAASAPAATTPQGAAGGSYYDPIPSGFKEAAASAQGMNPSFSQLASMAAAGNGGKLSIDQLGALSDIAYKTAPRMAPAKPPTPAEIAAQRALDLNEMITRSRQAAATNQDEYMRATQDGMGAYLQISKSRAYDPLQDQMYQDQIP